MSGRFGKVCFLLLLAIVSPRVFFVYAPYVRFSLSSPQVQHECQLGISSLNKVLTTKVLDSRLRGNDVPVRRSLLAKTQENRGLARRSPDVVGNCGRSSKSVDGNDVPVRRSLLAKTQEGRSLLITNCSLKNALYQGVLYRAGISPTYVYQVAVASDLTLLPQCYEYVQSDAWCTPVEVKKLTKKLFSTVDYIIIDIQDLGIFSHELLTLFGKIIQLAEKANASLIIADRPNPLSGNVEGPLMRVSVNKIDMKLPVRHGLTSAELFCLVHMHLKARCTYTCLPLQKYIRSCVVPYIDEQKLYGIALFHLLRQVSSFEIVEHCRDRLQCIALPEYSNFPVSRWYELKSLLHDFGIDISLCRYLSRKKQQYFTGIRSHVRDIAGVSCLATWLTLFHVLHEAHIACAPDVYLTRFLSQSLMNQLVKGVMLQEHYRQLQHDIAIYLQTIHPLLLYRPAPKELFLPRRLVV